MTNWAVKESGFARILIGASVVLGLVSVVKSQERPATAEFDVVSIRPVSSAGVRGGGVLGSDPCSQPPLQLSPGRLIASNTTVYRLITLAYGQNCRAASDMGLLSGGPAWLRSERYDIQATIPEGSPRYTSGQLMRGDAPTLQMMLQSLLAERFKLVLRRESRETPAYNLIVLRPGMLTLSEDQRLETEPAQRGMPFKVPTLFLRGSPISSLANGLAELVGRPVLDKTGLNGLFDIRLEFPVDAFTHDTSLGRPRPEVSAVVDALQRQLGLKLESTRAPREFLIVERIQKP